MATSEKNSSRSWIWLLALFTLASLVETIFYSQMLAFTPLYLPLLGVAQEDIVTLVGAIVAISNLVGIPFLPFWGALADRYSRKPIIIRSYFVLLTAGAIAFLAQNIWVFILARSVMSLALGNSGLMMTTLTEHLPKNRVGLGFSIMNSAAPIGAFLGPLTGGRIVDTLGFPALLLMNVVSLSIILIALWVSYKDPYRGDQESPILKMAWESVGIIWNSLRLRALFPALFLLFAGWMMAFTYVPLVITEIYTGNEPGTAVGLVIGASGLTTLILSPILGALSDKFGGWRVLFIGAGISVVLWPLPYLTQELVPFAIIWSILNGTVSAVFAISFSVLSGSTTDEVRGRVMSFAYMPVNFGFMLGPAIGTWITQSNIFNVFPAAAVLTFLGILTLAYAYHQPAQSKAVTLESV